MAAPHDDEGRYPAPWRATPPRAARRRFAAPRLILVEIAVGVLLVFGISGLFYLDLWKRASQDLPRLLPERVLTWATGPSPRLALERVATFPRWQAPDLLAPPAPADGDATSPDAPDPAVAGLPYFESEPGGEVFGLPLDQIRQIYRSADSVSLAVVPTEQGPASMLFVEVRDLLARKRVVARLAPYLEPAYRHVGFQVESVRRSPWVRYAGDDLAAPRVVSLDPYLVFAWGPAEGLDDLLDARVGGESEPLAGRPGFVAPPAVAGSDGDLTALLDPQALWGELTAPSADSDATTRLVDELDVITVRGRFVDDTGGEVVALRARVHEPETAGRLAQALVNRRHELVELAPTEAPWVLSLISERPLATLSALREVALRAGRDLGASAGAGLTRLGDRLSLVEIEAIVRLDWEVAAAFAGEIAWMALPPAPGAPPEAPPATDDWALVARLARPLVVEQALDRLLPFILGDAWSYGQVLVDGQLLHVVRGAGAGAEGAPPTPEVLAWRLDGPLLELAPRVELLHRLHLFRRSGQTYGDSGLANRALAALPDESAVVMVARPEALADGGGSILDLLARRLDPGFRIGFTLRGELPWLALSSNLGPWTFAGTVAQASRDEINAFTLPGLDPTCRAAHLAMCRLYPDAVPCRPLSLGRSAHIVRACQALFRTP